MRPQEVGFLQNNDWSEFLAQGAICSSESLPSHETGLEEAVSNQSSSQRL